MAELRETPLVDHHTANGARLGDFAGWRLPLQFHGTLAEHQAVREHAGAFDVSHLGTVWVHGPEAVDVLADTFTNDPWRLDVGESQYTLCCTHEGGIVDDLIVAQVDEERFVAMPNAANSPAVVAALTTAAQPRQAQVVDASPDWAILAVQGPHAPRLLADLDLDVDDLAFTQVGWRHHQGAELLVSRTGYTGEPGAELIVPAAGATELWQTVLEAGATPCGLGARDTLRLEMGYPLHGNDLHTGVLPGEARLGWAVRLEREGHPPGAAALLAAREQGPARRLWGLRGTGRRAPRPGMRVERDGGEVGEVTSGSFSPTLGVGIGLALLAREVDPGVEVVVDVRGRDETFEVVRPPFIDRDPRG